MPNLIEEKAMHSLAETTLDVRMPLIELQQTVATKLSQTAIGVVRDVILIIMNSRNLSPEDFVKAQVTPGQAPLAEIDERTGKFFRKMMGAINEELDKVPTLSESFVQLASHVKDSHIRQKLVEGIALPRIKELITDLDSIKTSIIDDIIAADLHDDESPLLTRICRAVQDFFHQCKCCGF
jgi:hypothetical protein